ncbi:tyrosyl-tRNA synthetase-like protein [Corynespora cassiicola Philippines]|uniref:Tyrosine--tRNA ligase n=1 Tax=Corynespora cassiicola Philippines TaxID=1448308 RepID=A0A2T2NXL3_CORCC|nr:tyrosyl-tRNA synthetase-like protein [Corynespora cassiicola Philippines]
MPLLRHLPRPRPYVCRQCIWNQRSVPSGQRSKWSGRDANPQSREAEWAEQAHEVKTGAQKSLLTTLEERGLVKDVAGGRNALDWLLTEKRIGAYVGVDPTAPSMHVGHLLPLMTLYWMYLHGYCAVTLLGGGTVQIGDPSGRTSARSRQGADTQSMNIQSIHNQLEKLWIHVRALGVKHNHPEHISRKNLLLNNRNWLAKLNAVELMRDLGSGMRLGTMLSRDSVKVRMENGTGMAISEFCYPLFQAYDWWNMYSNHGVQMQIGGSDQYGNICAGMDAVRHMRQIRQMDAGQEVSEDNPLIETFGLTTPLLTTASGEKFGKSAGNAVWLDKEMMNSFDLYQYFLRTADDDVERYLKLFTFIPVEHIRLVMDQQRKDASKRIAQHLLAKELVELAHGAEDAKKAEKAHKDAFSHGTNTFHLGALRQSLSEFSKKDQVAVGKQDKDAEKLSAYKKAFATSSAPQTTPGNPNEAPKNEAADNIITLPLSLLREGSFPQVLHAAGLVSSKSEGHRLITKRGAYVVVPNSGPADAPNELKWQQIPESIKTTDPNHYLVDWEVLVLRSGKSKIQVCRIVEEEHFEAEGLSCPGWDEFKAKRAESSSS